MSRLLLAFAVGISLLATTALAQQEQQGKRFYTYQSCDNVMTMTQLVMNKYGEQPLLQGTGIQFGAANGQPFTSSMMMFVNQDSGSWSLISLYPDGTGCMVANGKDFKPYSGPIGKKTPG